MNNAIGIRSSHTYIALQRRWNDLRHRTYTKSWSTYGEDLVIRQWVDGGPGVYLDVGAGRPRKGSNTYSFYRQGWHGVAVEPIHRLAREFRRVRSRDLVIEAVCGNVDGEVIFFEFSPYEYSTLSPDVAATRQREGFLLLKEHRMKQLRISSLPIGAEPHSNFIFSIDIEGGELNALEGIEWDRFTPTVICIEMLYGDQAENEATLNLLRTKGYDMVAAVGPSVILAHETNPVLMAGRAKRLGAL